MAPGVGVRDGLCCAPDGARLVRSWADSEECSGEVVENSCDRCTRLPDGDGDEIHLPPIFLQGRNEGGGYFSIFFVCLLSHPKSRDNLFSMRTGVNDVLSKLVRPGSGVSGTPLAYMRSGDVPWPASKRS